MDGVGGPHLERIVDAVGYDETFAAVEGLLQAAGSAEALRLAVLWGAATDPAVREAGLDVLSAAAQERDDLHEVALREALKVSPEEPHEDLRWSAAHLLLASLREVPPSLQPDVVCGLLRLQADPDGDVRWQVVFGPPELTGRQPVPDHPAVKALLRRLADEDPGVRDWAAFGMGLTGVDTPEVRRALRRLLTEPEEEASGEAAVAHARLHDPSVLPELLRQLARDPVGNLWVEAAAELAAPEALPLLERLDERGWAEADPRPQWLTKALLACGGGDRG